MNKSTRLIYILDRFPADTLNFIYNEIRVLEQTGFVVDIYSLLPGKVCPEEAADFKSRTKSIRPVGLFLLIQAFFYYLLRKPLILVGLFFSVPLDNDFNRLHKFGRTFAHLGYAVYFAWLIRNHKNHIHAHFASKAALSAAVAAKLNGNTFSFTAHGSATVYPPNQHSLNTKIRQASFVVAVSDYNKQYILKHCPDIGCEKIKINRTGVLLDQFPVRAPKNNIGEVFHIVCIASIFPIKNHAGLIRACGHLARYGKNFVVDLAGKYSPGMFERMKSIATEEGVADQVRFLGSVDHGQVCKLLSQADVAILTSFSEGIPVSLMEAMASGVPVIGPRVTGVPELVLHCETGLLVDPEDPQQIALAMKRMSEEPAFCTQISHAARKHIEADYDMVKNAHRLAEIFIQHLGEN